MDCPVAAGMAPFPRAAIAIAMVPILTDGLVESIIFSFLPYMIRDLGVPPNDVGFYSGLLGSCRSVALLFSAVFWGKLSDKIGRKPILQSGLAVVLVSQVLFGLSRTLTQAILCRAALGLFSSNLSVGKAFLRDLAPPEHRALAFSCMGTAYGAGFFVCAILGGALARPAETLPAS